MDGVTFTVAREDQVVAGVTVDRVSARPADDSIVPVSTRDDVAGPLAEDAIGAAIDDIPSVERLDVVSASDRVDVVGPTASGENIDSDTLMTTVRAVLDEASPATAGRGTGNGHARA